MEQTKRMDNLALMKALGILMVITIHVPLWKPEFMETDSVGRLVQYAFRIISEGVPIFVTINGLLLLKKKNMRLKAHVEKMLRLFLVLILWGGVLAVVGMHLDNNVDTFTLKDVLRAVLNIQVGAQYTGVLWFFKTFWRCILYILCCGICLTKSTTSISICLAWFRFLCWGCAHWDL